MIGTGKNLVARALKYVVRWALTTRDGVDSGDFPTSQVFYLGRPGDAVAWYPYGLHANAPAGELSVLLAMSGDPASRVALPGSPKSRPHPIAVGEVVLYHPATGAKVHLMADGSIVVDAPANVSVVAGGNVDVEAGGDASVAAAGNASVEAVGNVDVVAGANAAIAAGGLASIDAPDIQIALGATLKLLNEVAMATYNSHDHDVPGNPTTDPPNQQMVADTDTTVILKGS